ncbi:MAG: response regulator, partial [Pseudomonadota bacterium]
IFLDSAPGQGARISVRLALSARQATDNEDATETAPERAQQRSLDGVRVLAADDNPVNRAVIETLLNSLGCDTTLAAGGLEALALYEAHAYDVVLLDISMPEIDGVQTMRRMRKFDLMQNNRPSAPMIAASAHALSHQINTYIDAGFDAYVTKPITQHNLRSAILARLEDAAPDRSTEKRA